MDDTIIFDDGNKNNPMTEEQREVFGRGINAVIKPNAEEQRQVSGRFINSVIIKPSTEEQRASYGDSLLALDELNDFSEQGRDDLLKEIEQRIINGITKALKKQRGIIYTAESQETSWVGIPVQAKPDLDPDYFKTKVTC